MLFSDIVGQKHIVNRLKYLASSEKIPHALLFAGPEGVGKLTTALAFAQYINCNNHIDEDSCNICSQCHKFSHLIHPDLHFVFPVYKGNKTSVVCDDFIQDWRDFLLNSTYFRSSEWYQIVAEEKGQPIIYADEALEIIQKISVKNYEAKFKVIIIYQPERMHVATANKLLKVLEEPPAATVFILVSSQPEQLLPTIVSRCQLIKFSLVDDISIRDYLTNRFPQYAEQEIRQAVLLSNGSVPQALQFLEKSENNKQYFDLYVRLVRLCYEIKRKKPKVDEQIKWVHDVVQLSKEGQKDFLINSMRITRDNFLHHAQLKSMIHQTKEEEEFSQKFSQFMPYQTALFVYNYLSTALYHIERNGNDRIVFTDLLYQMMKHF